MTKRDLDQAASHIGISAGELKKLIAEFVQFYLDLKWGELTTRSV